MIYTFYSYKGGVGRSMAMANVAELFYRRGLRVVVIDWDLEAPGLENYFYSSTEDLEQVRCQLGLIDMLQAYKRHYPRFPLPPGKQDREKFRSVLSEYFWPVTRWLYPIHAPQPVNGSRSAALWLLPSGWRSEDRFSVYAEAVQRFGWEEFYTAFEGEAFFEWLRTELLATGLADVVLIDSRTGVTEVGGVCTRQLADVVVSFCATNLQNLVGLSTIIKSFKRDEVVQARAGRPIEIVVVPTRLESSEIDSRHKFEEQFRSMLDNYTPQMFRDIGAAFWDMRIPYSSKYAYSETLAVNSTDMVDDLADAYRKVATYLAWLAPVDSYVREYLATDIHIAKQGIVQQHLATAVQGPVGSEPGSSAHDSASIFTQSGLTLATPPFMVDSLPEGHVDRSAELAELVNYLSDVSLNRSDPMIATIQGLPGCGKTMLAKAVCHDQIVRETFKDGILWATLGQEPDLIGRVHELIFALTREHPTFTSLDAATDQLINVLANRRILMVIDDVWNEADLKPFIQKAPYCARLVTTRDSVVVPSAAKRVTLGKMQVTEALRLLWFDLAADLPHTLRDAALSVVSSVGGLPLPLKLANGILRDHVHNQGYSLSDALDYAVKAFVKPHQTTRTDAPVKLHEALDKALAVSLSLLSDTEANRYHELVIFPDDTNVPLVTLQRLWAATGGLNRVQTRQLCAQLHRLALLQTFDPGAEYIRLHETIRSTLKAKLAERLPGFHRVFLDAYGIKRWAELPPEEPYLWDYLGYHLNQAGRKDELGATVKDLRYLTIKTHLRSTLAVESDLLAAKQEAANDVELRTLRQHFVNAAHLLNQCATVQAVAGTLHSRIAHIALLEHISRLSETYLPRPYITSLHSLPDLPDPALIRTLTGHAGIIEGCAMSADGSIIVSASSDNMLKVWDAHTGVERMTLSGHTSAVNECDISADGSIIVSASEDGTLKIWDTKTGQARLTLTGHTDPLEDCAISADGTVIVSASRDHTLKVWDTYTGVERHTLVGHTSAVKGCALSADGSKVVSASLDRTLRVWDTRSGAELLTLRGHTAGVRSCAISADGTVIVSASRDNTLKVWNGQSGREELSLRSHESAVSGCAISADGAVIVSASRDNKLKTWARKTGELRLTLSGHTDWVNGCAISADGALIASASRDTSLKIWDTRIARDFRTSRGHTAEVKGCAVSPNGMLVVSASNDSTLKLWDTATGDERLTLAGHRGGVNSCAWSTDGQFIVSASRDHTLNIWNAHTGDIHSTLRGHTNEVCSCAISRDNTLIVSTSLDNTLKVWEAQTGVLYRTLAGHTAAVLSCAVSPDGQLIVSASDDRTLKVWAVESGRELFTLSGHTDWVAGCAISADGARIVSASEDWTLKVWSTQTGNLRMTLAGHTAGVSSCAISPDGTLIASTSVDKTLKVWDAITGACLTTLHVDGRLINSSWFPDGKHIVAVGARGVYFLRFEQ